MNTDKKYCKDCLRWYHTKADQCNIPIYKEENISKEFRNAVGLEFNPNKKIIFGHPSINNVNNDCKYYATLPKEIRFLVPIFRYFY